MDVEGFEDNIRPLLPWSFSPQFERLLQLSFGYVRPEPSRVETINDYLGADDLARLAYMTEVEFDASMSKARKGSDDTVLQPEPHPYDVFLMTTTLDQPSSVAVCLPTRPRGLAWYNGQELLGLDALDPKWRIASLSGPGRVLDALEAVPTPMTKAAMKRTELVSAVPVEEVDSILEPFSFRDGLNSSQRQAVATVAGPLFKEGFFCVQGPPGCGKTTTLAAMISVAVDQGPVLATAPSNKAVANIALKLLDDFNLHEMVVFGGNCDESVHFLNPKYRGLKYQALCNDLERLPEDSERKEQQLKKELCEWLHLPNADFTLSQLGMMCPHLRDDFSGRQLEEGLLRQAKVVLCTLNSAGSGFLQNSIRSSTTFLDEAGQASEAELYIATNFPRLKRMVVLGDPKQLPSTVLCRECAEADYGISWLEKVHRLESQAVHLLDTQYRMDPVILEFPNATFYGRRIQSGENVKNREPHIARPLVFVDTTGRGREEGEDFSFRNVYEVTVIKSLIATDRDIRRILTNNPNARIVAITPYRAQVKLLKDALTRMGLQNVVVGTVDSCQGQEGEIIIISTVRTNNVGFIDNAQRLNVALTRAKRVLRIVGDASFFRDLRLKSTLRLLCKHAATLGFMETTQVRSDPWSPPNWKGEMLWSPSLNSRFHHCINSMNYREKNMCMNTILAVATPDRDALGSRVPHQSKPCWYVSFLKGYHSLRVVWIAKEGDKRPMIEAHFAGTDKDCREFLQRHPTVPTGARIAEVDLSGLQPMNEIYEEETFSSHPLAAWAITNTLQTAIFNNRSLPDGGVQLDPSQERVACASSPLLIESRSGTGKTLVLLQHAAYHSDRHDERPLCFVTVSPRLCKELSQKYNEMQAVENQSLPLIQFHAFYSLLSQLLRHTGIRAFEDQTKCSFVGFVDSRKSHTLLSVDPSLAENEIGGVITGSLEAVIEGNSLSRDQYLATIRSNIENKSQKGRDTRNRVYDAYKSYHTWKREHGLFDTGDVVLTLLEWTKENEAEIFSAGYLDEIQDLSYAAIVLICRLAGRRSLRWICAGDPAQMISPGCSFTFDGLKETLLFIHPGIESSLKDVCHLVVNYRTTKDVLELGNAILAVAKCQFPGAIGYAKPETARKDLGYKVLLVDWDLAWAQEVKLGQNQALIYSCRDHEEFEKSAEKWIGAHPFTVSSLDSKGLEFDDVVVAFDLERKVWDVEKNGAASLRMLRELYVAVTRARRRVVILVKKNNHLMRSFFESLNYNFQTTGAEMILREFDMETSPEEWRKKGIELFEDEQFLLASRCFEAAGDEAMHHWCQGRLFQEQGNNILAAVQSYGVAIKAYNESGNFEKLVELSILIERTGHWESELNSIIIAAVKSSVDIERGVAVKLFIRCEAWDRITADDLKERSFIPLFLSHRDQPELKRIVRNSSESDRQDIANEFPALVGDYFLEEKRIFDEAVRLYVIAFDSISATKVILSLLNQIENGRKSGQTVAMLEKSVGHWLELARFNPTNRKVDFFLHLVRSPLKESSSSVASSYMKELGRDVVLVAIDLAKADRTLLYNFDARAFAKEVTDTLVERYYEEQTNVVEWFMSKGDVHLAVEFSADRKQIGMWSDSELCKLVLLLAKSETDIQWLYTTIQAKGDADLCALVLVGSRSVSIPYKEVFVNLMNQGKGKAKLRTQQNSIRVLSDAVREERRAAPTSIHERIGRVVENVIMAWSIPILERMLLKMLSVLTILESVEKNSTSFRVEYSGIFRQIEKQHQGVRSVLHANTQKERFWLLQAFEAYSIVLSVPKQHAFDVLELALSGGFTDLALAAAQDASANIPTQKAVDILKQSLKMAELGHVALHSSWKALSTRESSERSFPEVLELWSEVKGKSVWDNAFGPDFEESSLVQVLLMFNPYHCCTEFADDEELFLFYLYHYGHASCRYLVSCGGGDGIVLRNGVVCRAMANFADQLKRHLSSKWIPPANEKKQPPTSGGGKKKGKKKNKQETQSSQNDSPANPPPAPQVREEASPSNSKKGSKKKKRNRKKKGRDK